MAGWISPQSVREYVAKENVKFVTDVVNALKTLGYYAMLDAYKKREFKHRTRNLHDSYGSAVFVNGRLWLNSKRYLGGIYSRKVDPNTKKTGRETLDEFFNTAKIEGKKDEAVLVVVAAMYYAEYLEDGTYGGKYKLLSPPIQVISVAQDYIQKNYWSALYKVYDKYGIKEPPEKRIIAGRDLGL